MAPAEIIEQATAEDLTAQSRRLQDKAQAPRHRYRSGVEQSAEGDEPALCFSSVAKCARYHCNSRQRTASPWRGLFREGRSGEVAAGTERTHSERSYKQRAGSSPSARCSMPVR